MKILLALVRNDLRLAFRDKAVLFFNYAFPLLFFFGFAEMMDARASGTIAYVVSTVAIVGILGNGLFGAGMRAVQEREAHILRRFKVAPITATPILAASIVSGVLIYLPTLGVLLLLAYHFYGLAIPATWPSLILLIIVGTAAFRAMGLILAAVANSAQESNILIQVFYMPMLFLSGATFPIALLPGWAQTLSQYLPASYLVVAFQGVFLHEESIADNGFAVVALLVTLALCLFVAARLFRWEKGETIRSSAKLAVLAVLSPFLILGTYQLVSGDPHLLRARQLWRSMRQNESFLIENVRVFVGDGTTHASASVLLQNGRIGAVYPEGTPQGDSGDARIIDGTGKTLLPGLIDAQVRITGSGGLPAREPIDLEAVARRSLIAQLYSGVTTVHSSGDPIDLSRTLARRSGSGDLLGSELIYSGPILTTSPIGESGDLSAPPEPIGREWHGGSSISVTTRRAATAQVRALEAAGVGMIHTLLGASSFPGSLAESAHSLELPILAQGQGTPPEIRTALLLGARALRGPADKGLIDQELFQQMGVQEIFYLPSLSPPASLRRLARARRTLTGNRLVQQTLSESTLEATRQALDARIRNWPQQEAVEASPGIFSQNLQRAQASGVQLVTGSGAGSALVFHAMALQRQLRRWVDAGLPPRAALLAATSNAARLLNQDHRIGFVRAGYDANLLLVDGDPEDNIAVTQRISEVFLRGERMDRGQLLKQAGK